MCLTSFSFMINHSYYRPPPHFHRKMALDPCLNLPEYWNPSVPKVLPWLWASPSTHTSQTCHRSCIPCCPWYLASLFLWEWDKPGGPVSGVLKLCLTLYLLVFNFLRQKSVWSEFLIVFVREIKNCAPCMLTVRYCLFIDYGLTSTQSGLIPRAQGSWGLETSSLSCQKLSNRQKNRLLCKTL